MTTSTVSFKITNSEKNSAPFKAKFTSDSGNYLFIQLTNFRFSPRREYWHLLELKAHTFMCRILLFSMESRKKEDQLLKLRICFGPICSREAYLNMYPQNQKEVGQELSVRKNEIFIFFNNSIYLHFFSITYLIELYYPDYLNIYRIINNIGMSINHSLFDNLFIKAFCSLYILFKLSSSTVYLSNSDFF